MKTVGGWGAVGPGVCQHQGQQEAAGEEDLGQDGGQTGETGDLRDTLHGAACWLLAGAVSWSTPQPGLQTAAPGSDLYRIVIQLLRTAYTLYFIFYTLHSHIAFYTLPFTELN